MVGLIGIKKGVPIEIREKLSIKGKEKGEVLEKLKKEFLEVVIVNTCNRTEIYFEYNRDEEKIVEKIFNIIGWNRQLINNTFFLEGRSVYKHLFELAAGYHSKIIGEDQILGQIRDSYRDSLDADAVGTNLGRLFQDAIACGKEFKTKARLFEIPVSSASIVVNRVIKENINKIMIIGYGEVGKLLVKYFLSHKVENIILALRDRKKAIELENTNVKIVNYDNRRNYYSEVDAIISCTASPDYVVFKRDVNKINRKLLIFDMAVPRDVEETIEDIDNIQVYNIDNISAIDDENKALRIERMKEWNFIIDKYLCQYEAWDSLREIAPLIKDLKVYGNEVYKKRAITYKNKSKSKEDLDLVETLLKSTSDAYINRAIEVLKEEKLRGCDNECQRIIKKIFLNQ